MNKYYLCEFHEQNGEFEYTHHHVYSDKFFKKLGIKDSGKDHFKILNHFFGNLDENNNDGYENYWTNERLVCFNGIEEIKENEIKTLKKVHIYND